MASKRMTTKTHVEALLSRLPEDEDRIAELLFERNLVASSGTPVAQNCPLARYLQEETGRSKIFVRSNVVEIGARSPWTSPDLVPLPLNVRRFVSAYDIGRYLELQERFTWTPPGDD